jgi:cobyrinic acid a,c-diamide synthase
MKGIVIAATQSGSGKTTITSGMMASLRRKGKKVAPYKIGPDFIDPGHHARITKGISRNLDGWMLSHSYNLRCFGDAAMGADFAIVEGVMGLFDGYDGKSEAGSTAQMAKWLGLPVLLIVNAGSMARSVAAIVQGFENFDPDLNFAGVIFNNVASERHLIYLQEAIENTVKMPCWGGIPRNSDICIPERHLGLVTSDEFSLPQSTIDLMADMIEKHIDLESHIMQLPEIKGQLTQRQSKTRSPKKVRIAVARDKAFCFYYPDNFDWLIHYGAELVFFSPTADQNLPTDIGGIYFGGGYPELFAEQLSRNHSLLHGIKEQSINHMPIYGECGGFMYLCQSIKTYDQKKTFTMADCFPFHTCMSKKLTALGYREVHLEQDTIIGKKGMTARGHEFHYSTLDHPISEQIQKCYQVAERKNVPAFQEGYQMNQTLGSYIHLHFGSRPELAENFVNNCHEFKRRSHAAQ